MLFILKFTNNLQSGASQAAVDGLQLLFSGDGTFGRPFQGLETQYQQLKFYRQHLNLVVSLNLNFSRTRMTIYRVLPRMILVVAKNGTEYTIILSEWW